MTISKDRVKPSPLPDSWKLKEIFATGIVLGSYLALMTVIFFWAMHKTDFFTVCSHLTLSVVCPLHFSLIMYAFAWSFVLTKVLLFRTNSVSDQSGTVNMRWCLHCTSKSVLWVRHSSSSPVLAAGPSSNALVFSWSLHSCLHNWYVQDSNYSTIELRHNNVTANHA